jgi:hypothetical protein
MNHLKKKTQSLAPKRWQSREEILKAHLDSLPPDELRRVRPAYYWLCFGYEAWKRAHVAKANFDSNQPRDGQGRWVDSDDDRRASVVGGGGLNNNALESFAAARRRGRSAAYCLAQYAIDGLLCNSVEPASRAASCWRQAAERFGNCLSGRPISPLNY